MSACEERIVRSPEERIVRSPFPGVNPYLEAPALWSEVHSWLIVDLARLLNQRITPKYRAAVEKRVYEDLADSIERYIKIREVITREVITIVRVAVNPAHFLSKPMTELGARHCLEVNLQQCDRFLAIPLRSGDETVQIDLNVLMQMVYESAALDLAIDYGQQPTPGLSPDDFDWVPF
jgi:Protein of unknown function (DUF4058)